MIIGVCGSAAATAAEPPGYYDSTLGLTGVALRTELRRIVKSPHTPLTYSATRVALETCDEDPANAANVILIYTRRSEPKSNFVHNPPQNSTEWNREHLWPDSRGILSGGPDYADLFNLRPADVEVNNTRANLAFEETTAGAGAVVPGTPEAPLTSRDADSWEPPPEVKGDIARSLFYMELRYDGDDADTGNLQLTDNMTLVSGNAPFMGRMTTLLLWHLADPVSAAERQRNDCVQARQGNRNPFIDRPEWISSLFGNPLSFSAARAGNLITLTWWAGLENAALQSSPNMITWSAAGGTPVINGLWRSQSITLSPADLRQFWRVRFRGIEAP